VCGRAYNSRVSRAPWILACLALAAACASPFAPPARFAQKLVILGFDGMDPDLAERWIKDGRLPNLAKLRERGGLHRLETTHSPESPTAWASFATGVNAGKHNIYDFLVRDTRTYLPDLAMVKREPPRFLFNYIPIARPRLTSTRGGTSFWVTAGRAGVRSSILTVPVTFPPEDVPNGELLAGLPLPDIRGTMGTFYYFATDLSRYEEGDTEFGGILRRVVFDQRVAQAELVGPPNPIVRQEQRAIAESTRPDAEKQAALAELAPGADVRVPFTITWNHEARTANIDIQGQTIHLAERQWSRWVELEFRVNLLVRLRGMAQMFLIKAGTELQLYVSPINWHPASPPAPMSSPPRFAADLFERLGPYRTLGWPEATWALNEDRLDEQTFLDDLEKVFDDRAQAILSRVDAKQWDLLVGVIETTDRVQHMMWRLIDPDHPMYDAEQARLHGNAILQVYQRADRFVGDVVSRLPPDAPLLVVSDHGFHSFRWSVNLNTWLVQHGYMALRGQRPGEKKLDDLFGGGTFWENVDWSRTQAYAMGLGQIYVNLSGREGQGIVQPGADYDALIARLGTDLRAFRDPQTNAPVVRNVYRRADIYDGPYFEEAADLQVGLEAGYRTSWQTALGGAPPALIEPNMRKWSGDHGSYDYQTTAGILVSSVPVTSDVTRIIDIAPTVLKYFGLAIPPDVDGKPIF
jgi:predicted AlkP superfamily phosphohydrolase/phosphomutase